MAGAMAVFRGSLRGPAADEPTCASCRHFVVNPARLEREIAGWATLGSAYGAVRGGDGLCTLHGRYLGARSHCASHGLPAPSGH